MYVKWLKRGHPAERAERAVHWTERGRRSRPNLSTGTRLRRREPVTILGIMLIPILRSVSAFLCALATVHAGTPLDGFSPVKVGEGPLVCFIHPEDESGRSVSGGGPRTEVMYLCDPAAGAKAVPVWRGQVPLVRPVQRMTQHLTVIERKSECYLWDMEKGSATPLWPGENETSFLKADGGKIFFLRRLLPETSSGMTLGRGKNGKMLVESWFRARDKVCTFTPGDQAGAVELAAPILEHIVETGPAGIWAVTADEPRKLCLISNDGTVTDIIPFDRHWVARETHPVFSPARDYLALSVLHDEQDFHRERELIVVDVKRKTVSHVSHNVSIDRLLFSGYPRPVEMTWVDGTHLLFGHLEFGEGKSEQQVLDAPSGKLSAPTEVQRKAATPPQSPARQKKGLFDSEFGKIWFVGDKELAGSVLDKEGVGVRDMEISKDGKWAAFCDPDSNGVFLLDGANRRKRELVSGWAYGIKWLPAVDAGK